MLLITGEEKLDIAYASGKTTFEAINHLPIFYAWQDGLQHIGTFGAKNGGDLRRARVELARLDDAQRSEGRENVQGRRLHALQGSDLARRQEENRLTEV